MAFATPKRVTFNKEVSKWSLGSTTPSVSRLSQIENKRDSTSSTTSTKLNIKTNNINSCTNNSSNLNNENSITVAVRVRPLNEKEKESGYYDSIRVDDSNKEITLYDKSNNKQHKFTCDYVITDQESTKNKSSSILDNQQQYVYESIGKPLLEKSFEGYNVSIFAYGQTGSGKTYSMIGSNNQPGLIPRLLDDLFEKKSDRDKIVSSTHLEISYYEIYNEKIYDLLPSDGMNTSNAKDIKSNTNSKHLQIREDPKTGPYIVDLSTLGVDSAKDAKQWLDIGNKRRATACTNMNQKSSRSHSVLQINLTQILKHNNEEDLENITPAITGSKNNSNKSHSEYLQVFSSRINLIDLAGSERINSAFDPNTNFTSNSNSNSKNATRFRESTCINKSLLTLGKIICLLSERQNAAAQTPTTQINSNSNNAMINGVNLATINGYLPYRESVLTWLLKDSLGGNAKTAMLSTINASSCYIDETLCTLRYAAKTASIKNAVEMNHNFRQKYINEFGEVTEISLAITPLKHIHDAQLETALKRMEKEWKDKLEEAERIKQKEIKDLEKSLIVFYENETNVQNCCLINLNEDPSFSEKLIYKLKSNTTIGGDKNMVDINLTGPLIGSIHSKILCNSAGEYFIEQLDKNCVTYLNGEVIEVEKQYQLNHCDIIIFGGSHFFRFNNPSRMTNKTNQFKDYQFAKAELERKQNELIQKKVNEALNKYKQDDDLKMKELKQKYEKNLELIKSDLEKEKNARKLEVEQIKTESSKMLKQFQKKILIETKINELEHDQAKMNNECNKQEQDLLLLKTPTTANNSKILLNKLLLSESSKKPEQSEIIQSHASSNGLFAISLCVTEANKICNTLGFDYEFKRYEVNKQQAICVIDKKLKLITLWNLDTFEFKLNMLRDIYLKYIEENGGNINEVSISSTSSTDSQMVTDSMDEWQKLTDFEKNDEIFSPRIIENAIGSINKDSVDSANQTTCKRRLSMLSNNNSSTNLNKKIASSAASMLPSTTCLSKSIDNLSIKSSIDQLDNLESNKRKCINQTPQVMRTPLLSSSCLNLKTKSFDYLGSNNNIAQSNSNNLNIGNSLLFATCRDALNDELQIEDELSDDEDEMEEYPKFLKSTTDDFYLKSYAKLVFTLKKLVETQLENHNENQVSSNNLNKPLYAMKIFQYFTELTTLEPNYLLINLTNPDALQDIKKLFKKIKKGLNLIKDFIRCLYQVIYFNDVKF